MTSEKHKKNTEISARVNSIIKDAGETRNNFAKKLGYNRTQTVYDILNGKAAPSFDFFNKFMTSEYSEVYDIAWLLTGNGSMMRSETPAPMSNHDAVKAAIYKEERDECRARIEQLIQENTRLEERLKSVSIRSDFPFGAAAEPAVSYSPAVPELPSKPASAGGKLKEPCPTKNDL